MLEATLLSGPQPLFVKLREVCDEQNVLHVGSNRRSG